MKQGKQTTIGMVLFTDVTQLDFTAPYEVFARVPNVKIHILAETLEPVKSDRGLRLLPDMRIDQAPELDILFIPGGPGQLQAQKNEKLLELIRRQAAKKDGMIASVCTGSLILGAAGILKDRKVTTHWSSLDILPILGATAVNEQVVEDGNIISGAGVINGLDMALHLAKKIATPEVVSEISRFIEYPHESQSEDKQALQKLSAELLARNPYRKQRIEEAKKIAGRLWGLR